MESAPDRHTLIFENLWNKDVSHVSVKVLKVWGDSGGPVGDKAHKRLRQLVFVVKDARGEVVGVSTALKVYVNQLRNHFYAIRLTLIPAVRIPGLTSKLLVSTRDFLESVHSAEDVDTPIGIITLVKNEQLKERRNEAIWPASGMVYIGNSEQGHHIRVYYFKGARITP